MNDPWFNANLYGWIPGTAIGVLVGLWGSLVGAVAPRGRFRGLVVGGSWALLLASAVLLSLGLIALVSGQPYGVWYSLSLAGAIGLPVTGVGVTLIPRVYRAAEERKLAARDLTDVGAEKASPHLGGASFRAD
jgi:hypothetical protein